MLGPIALNSHPLRNAIFTNDHSFIDFSSIDSSYYGAHFSVTIDESPFTDKNEYPSVTSYHFINIVSEGFTHRYAVAQPLSVYGDSALYQCFGVALGIVEEYSIPGVLRAPLDISHVPADYPKLPTRSAAVRDARDPRWDLIGPSDRIRGRIRFASEPVGEVKGYHSHRSEAIFADELVREAFARTKQEERDAGLGDGRDD